MTLPAVAWRPVASVAAATFAIQLLASTRYGYHRDELYFRLLAEHPAWGYVDQGPATPLIARACVAIFGDSFLALRVPAILCIAAIPFIVALIVRELGGERTAQWLGAVAVAFGGFPILLGHVLITATFDIALSLLALLFITRALRRADGRWWLAAGAVTGLALYNKQLIILLGLAVVIAVIVAGPRDIFRDRLLWAGLAVALVVGSPNLIYQFTHGLPQATMAAALAENDGLENRISFVPLQLLLVGLTLVPIWISGLLGLLRDPRWRRIRALAVAYLIACVLVLITGGRPDYAVVPLIFILCAGFARLAPVRFRLAGVAVAINVAVATLIALPVFPVGTLGDTPVPAINQVVQDEIGWETYVAQVAAVHAALPPADRSSAAIITGNYGEAGAIARFGPTHGLPRAYSGQNELFFLSTPPETTTVVIAVGLPRTWLASHFKSCELAARLDNGVGVDNEEQGVPITVCRGPQRSWADLWPEFQHYD